MTRNGLLVLLCALALLSGCFAPNYEWEALQSPTKNHLRGLCAVDDSVVWASGANGTVIMSTDGGTSWLDVSIAEADSLDFRDIHAIDRYMAWVISAGNGVRIYRTDNGGASWHEQYNDPRAVAFYDGFDFAGPDTAMAYGDPIDGQWSVLTTTNGGNDWEGVSYAVLPDGLDGEGGYAASGTGIVLRGTNAWIAAGGGSESRLLHTADFGETWNVVPAPLESAPGAGIFSMAFDHSGNGVLVGGNYVDSTNASSNCAFSSDYGQTWTLVTEQQPNGYRSCVAVHQSGSPWLTTGRTGSEYSNNGGRTWQAISTEGYYSCAMSSGTVFASGRRGKLARLFLQ